MNKVVFFISILFIIPNNKKIEIKITSQKIINSILLIDQEYELT